MSIKKETTTQNTSVDADDEQSFNNTNIIITENESNNNSQDDILTKMQMEILNMMDPSYLKTISMKELYETVYDSKQPIVDGLLYAGTYIFAGSPKVGKSFFAAQIAYHISMGIPLWEYPTHKGTVLYLALEDTRSFTKTIISYGW